MLTKKQKDLLIFINDHIQSKAISPSFDEMKVALNLKSKSGIHRLIKALEEREFIRRLPNRARTLEVLKLPDALEAGQKRDELVDLPGADVISALAIPMMGRIAAGVPISAIEIQSDTIEVPMTMLSGGDHYALEVRGDSMIDAGILDGDTVVINRTNSADNGDIVVAYIIEDGEATLKKLRRKGNSIALEAANPSYETRIFGPDQVKVQGKMVGLIRQYK